MTKSKKRGIKGFTLVELLVVIAIIGVLAALGLSTFTNSRRAARDTRRLGDVKTIASSLEQYFNDNTSAYPTALSGLTTPTAYLDRTPADPKNLAPYIYNYNPTGTGNTGYTLDYCLEKANDTQAIGTNQAITGCGGQGYRVTR